MLSVPLTDVRDSLLNVGMKLFILLLSFWTSSVFAQNVNPRFKYISKDQGLTSNKILCIRQDKAGFMWFGTEDGLTRFDGTNYVVFRNNANDRYSLVNNYVHTIYEDPENGNLWIGTARGLCYLDVKSYRFYAEQELNKTLKHVNVFSIFIDKQRNKWIGTFNGLYFCAANSQRPILFNLTADRAKRSINCIFEDSKKILWIGAGSGLYQLNRADNTFKRYQLANKTIRVNSITEDSRHHLWISTFANGVYELSANRTVRNYCVDNGLLRNSNKVQNVIEDELGNLFFAVRDGAGLHYLNYKTQKTKVYDTDLDDPASINSTAITCVFKDSFKNIWIGTWSNGLNFIDKNKKRFDHYKYNSKPDGLISNYIRSAFQDSEGDIWVGTKDDGSLSKFDPKKRTFSHYQSFLYNKKTSAYAYILAIGEASKGKLLIGTFDNGLLLLDKRTGGFSNYSSSPANKSAIADNKVSVVFKDRNNTIWVATKALQTFNPQKGTFRMVQDSIFVKCILDYSEDELYLGGSVGLFAYNRKTKRLIRFHKKTKINGGEVPDITGMVKDAQGNLWLSTVGKGLIRFDPKARKVKTFTVANGLPSNIACSVQMDKTGNLWISTTNGLTKFNPATGALRNYYVAEGLQGNEFERYASLKTTDGYLLFGGNNGFTYFHPQSIKDNPVIPKVILTDFKIFNKPAKVGDEDSPLSEAISNTRRITLNHKQSVISFEFSALNFSSAVYNQYAYKLEPLEKEWNYIGTRNVASYSSLPPGNYTFKVKASNNDGIWNTVPTTLSIKVLPAPWKSWWAYLFYFSILGGLIYLWLRYKNFETQLQIASVEREKLEELNNIKSQFFTNISHEFKTPLTMIVSPVNKLLETTKNEEDKKHLAYIQRNTIRLQNLINQLIDFKRIENNSMAAQYSRGDLIAFTKELTSIFEPLAEEHHIEMVYEGPQQLITCFDFDKTEKILYNVLSNAIKYTPDHGKITVGIQLMQNFSSAKSSFDGAYYQVQISNTGSKIDPAHLPHLFQNYYHIDRTASLSQPGSGIGLSFTKELVTLLGGTINVESNDDTTCFTINLPDHKVLQQDISTSEELNSPDFFFTQRLLEVLKFERELSDEKQINQKAPSVLVIEDNKELRDLLFTTLSQTYKVTAASEGFEGLELARKINPAIIISDIVMPKMNGIDLCREIKSTIELNHIPVVLLTASGSDASKLEGMENGADAYIEKPFDLEFLKLQIKNIIQTRQAQREAFARKFNIEPERTERNSVDEQWVMKAVKIVENNLDNSDFDVERFVKEMNMSRTSLYQKIKALTDLSINEFIVNIRLKKAADLLKNSDLTISEIAYKVGFNTPHYFAICFKRNFQMSPSQFVEKHRSSAVTKISLEDKI
jgi:signal transduction histidine kinase/ligand-binding sensor domain-containing protein/DNA-binding response OmpR family regulator